MLGMMPQNSKNHPTATLAPALAAFQRQGLAVSLEALYQRLPATICARQGHCCGLLPPLAPLEMLAWLAGLAARPAQERAEQVAALVEHFLLNAAQRRPCPWARTGSCAVYAQRFLACRAYGLWSAEAYQARRQAALTAQQAVAAAWAGLGVRLPAQVLAPGPDYCRQVSVSLPGEKSPNIDGLLRECEEDLARWAQGLPPEPLLAACGGDISYLLARLALGEQACLAAKVGLTKALLAGKEHSAGRLLAAHQAQARAWALAWEESTS